MVPGKKPKERSHSAKVQIENQTSQPALFSVSPWSDGLGFRVKGLGYIPGVGFRLRVLAVWGVGRWVKLGLGFKSLWVGWGLAGLDVLGGPSGMEAVRLKTLKICP